MKIYAVIDKLKTEYPLQRLCEVLIVSRSCYYDWKNKKTYQLNSVSQSMEDKVIAVFKANKRRYGTRRIVAELGHQGIKASPYKVRKALVDITAHTLPLISVHSLPAFQFKVYHF
ncbi:hypothetical protein GO495_21570 [Chitinophaga oryziterrae]|uniref:HTH-like domain-containing protein n=2 Tax=Chitinophaga oryziterrae TaxID=1031224 RepID=A0A6N8JFC6_9BACT|nr:IS3 family transposase [Chitinophaga oryziterrae]MVT43201.1 hypothetical protein [Chitinophaga oryziterrae]